MSSRLCLILLTATIILMTGGVLRADPASPRSRSAELMKNRQYADAIKILSAYVEGKDDTTVATEDLMLGECYYLTGEYEKARPYLSSAFHALPDGNDKIISEYRLACVAYRMKDESLAMEKIDSFVGSHPNDSRVGRLLIYKMSLMAKRGKDAEKEIVALCLDPPIPSKFWRGLHPDIARKNASPWYPPLKDGTKRSRVETKQDCRHSRQGCRRASLRLCHCDGGRSGFVLLCLDPHDNSIRL